MMLPLTFDVEPTEDVAADPSRSITVERDGWYRIEGGFRAVKAGEGPMDTARRDADHNPAEPGEVSAQDYTAEQPAPPKDRATRRAMGQRKPRVKYVMDMATGKYTFRENGPQRAERRAERHGLTVGAPVRAEIVARGVADQRPSVVSARRRGGVAGPLDFGQRCDRYARQSPRRRLTPAQHRRAQAKANHAAAPFGHRQGEWSA